MQVCGFVDGLVGSRICLPACLYPLFFPLLFFVFCFWIQTTRHWGHQRSRGKWQMNMECVGGLFALRMRERERRFYYIV